MAALKAGPPFIAPYTIPPRPAKIKEEWIAGKYGGVMRNLG
jgi:hypothetical protein